MVSSSILQQGPFFYCESLLNISGADLLSDETKIRKVKTIMACSDILLIVFEAFDNARNAFAPRDPWLFVQAIGSQKLSLILLGMLSLGPGAPRGEYYPFLTLESTILRPPLSPSNSKTSSLSVGGQGMTQTPEKVSYGKHIIKKS